MTEDEVVRYSRHILLPEVGGLGQEALLAHVHRAPPAAARLDSAAVHAIEYLRAGGVSVDESGDTLEHDGPAQPGWWPAVEGDDEARSIWRGATTALRIMVEIIERGREPSELVDDAILAELHAIARAALPAECCGYLVGNEIVRCTNAQAEGENPVAPERGADAGYVISGKELFAFARAFDTDRPPRVVYHSHASAGAYFSDVDQRVAALAKYAVQHLVLGADGKAAMYAWSPSKGRYVERWRR